jgi:release factor glutamine methyltransferase
MTTLGEMMADVRNALALSGIEDPAAEARIIVGGLLGLERVDFITGADRTLSGEEEAAIHAALARRARGEPPYRILGRRAFYGLELSLSAGTLEPRPDTEILVDLVLDELKGREREALEIADLGTGTGAICLALLSQLPRATGLGVDISEDALRTATENAVASGLADRFTTCRSDWFEQIVGRHDVIVSNPPYIATRTIASLDREVRDFDPLLALDGGEDGLDAYRMIAARAPAFLKQDGVVAVETGFDQRQAVEEIFRKNDFILAQARKDYGGNDRAQAFRRN